MKIYYNYIKLIIKCSDISIEVYCPIGIFVGIMDRNNEKRVVEEICDISGRFDYSDNSEIDAVLSEVKDRDYFRESVFGKRYLQRLTMLLTGVSAKDCVLCGKEAINNVVCNTCIQKISQIHKQRGDVATQIKSEPKLPMIEAAKKVPVVLEDDAQANSSSCASDNRIDEDITIEELFKDMDDSLLQLASQVTAKSIKRLSWVNIAISIVNFIMTFFLALFLWKFITS